MKFFPNDWLSDEALSGCTLAAQGLWIKLLCLMHKGVRRGYLMQANGQPLPLGKVARIAGASTDEVAHLCQELLTSGVASATEHGIIYSRRMARDAAVGEVRSSAGKKGAESRYGLPKPDLPLQNDGKQDGKPNGKPVASGYLEEEILSENQNAQTMRAEGREISKTPAWLAQVWCNYSRLGHTHREKDVYAMTAQFEELCRHVPFDAILADLERPDRDRNENFWELRKRLTPTQNGKPAESQSSKRGRALTVGSNGQ